MESEHGSAQQRDEEQVELAQEHGVAQHLDAETGHP